MVLSATPVCLTDRAYDYFWLCVGAIVASGPRQLGRDIRVIDTHPRPRYGRKKHLTVSTATADGHGSGAQESLALTA
jgi:hypothetical protein